MSATAVIVLDLVALGLLIAYWEWRYQQHGWGRGWTRTTAATWSAAHHPAPNPELERWVWGEAKEYDHWHVDPEGGVHFDVRRIPENWEFNMPLPSVHNHLDPLD